MSYRKHEICINCKYMKEMSSEVQPGQLIAYCSLNLHETGYKNTCQFFFPEPALVRKTYQDVIAHLDDMAKKPTNGEQVDVMIPELDDSIWTITFVDFKYLMANFPGYKFTVSLPE